MDLHPVLFTGNDHLCVIIKQFMHHINNIAVSTILNNKKMHGRIQAEGILNVRKILGKGIAEMQQFLCR
jgi:hypothetical protein